MGMHKGIVGREPTSTDQGPGSLSPKANDIGRRGDNEQYLRDYITRKQESDSFFAVPKKLTFEEWWQKEDPPGDQEYWCRLAWKAAQENKL